MSFVIYTGENTRSEETRQLTSSGWSVFIDIFSPNLVFYGSRNYFRKVTVP